MPYIQHLERLDDPLTPRWLVILTRIWRNLSLVSGRLGFIPYPFKCKAPITATGIQDSRAEIIHDLKEMAIVGAFYHPRQRHSLRLTTQEVLKRWQENQKGCDRGKAIRLIFYRGGLFPLSGTMVRI